MSSFLSLASAIYYMLWPIPDFTTFEHNASPYEASKTAQTAEGAIVFGKGKTQRALRGRRVPRRVWIQREETANGNGAEKSKLHCNTEQRPADYCVLNGKIKGIDSRADSCYRLGMSFGVNIRKAVHGFLAFGLLVALGHGPVMRHTPGDTNGDQRVDVLDMQALIASALAGGTQDPQADVNRDGVVDVRDLQALLLLSEEEDNGKTESRDADPGVLQSAKLDMPHLRAEFRMPSLSTACQLLTENELHHVAVDQAAPLPPSKADRYALSLTPHAPPHRA